MISAWKPCRARPRSSKRWRAPSRSAGGRSSSRPASSWTEFAARFAAGGLFPGAVFQHGLVALQLAVFVPAALARHAAPGIEARFGEQRSFFAEALVLADRHLPAAARHPIAPMRSGLAALVELGDLESARIAGAAVGSLAAGLAMEVVAVVSHRLARGVPALVADQRTLFRKLLLALPHGAAVDQQPRRFAALHPFG